MKVVEEYITKKTWRVHENANRIPSIGGLKTYIAEKALQNTPFPFIQRK